MASAEVVRNTYQSTGSQLVGTGSISPLVETRMGSGRESNAKKDAKGKGKTDSTGLRGNNGEAGSSTRRRASKSQALPNSYIIDNGKGKGNAFIEKSAVDASDDTEGDNCRDSDGIVKQKIDEIERLIDENAESNNHSQKQAKERPHKSSGQDSATSSAMDAKDNNDGDDNGEASTNSLICQTDKIERQIGEETNRCAQYREEVEGMKTELENMRALKVTILDDMGDHSVTEENFKRLETMCKHLDIRYRFARAEIANLEEQLKAADLTIKNLEKELEKVRKDLREEKKKTDGLEMDVIDLNKRVKILGQQVVSLQADLDMVKEERDKYKRDSEALKDTDASTPTSSEVSLKMPEDGPVAQPPAAAGSGRSQASQVQVHLEERVDRAGSPSATIADSDASPPLARTPTGSSGTNRKEKPLGEVLKTSTQSREYSSLLPGAVVRETITTIIHIPEKPHRKNSHVRRKSSHSSKKSI